jgi:hypothetical protein
MREADVGLQSADTIKLSFRSNCFEKASGPIRQYPIATAQKETASARRARWGRFWSRPIKAGGLKIGHRH